MMLGQILTDDQLNEYSSLENRWYVNFVLNEDEEYEVYSITEAPPVNITDYEELKNSNFDKLGEGFVPEYDSRAQIMYLKNMYRVGKLIVDIQVEGFEDEIPSSVKTNLDIAGPHDYSKRVRKSETLENMRMGEYTFKCTEPVTLDGYTERAPELKVTLQHPVDSEPKELTADARSVTLNRDAVNAVLTVTYTYYPDHVHTYDDGVVTKPTCTEKGYTTYTCTGYDNYGEKCTVTKQADFVAAYGHDYDEEVIEPTCVTDGKRIYTCRECGYTYEEPGDDALGHQCESKVTKPTCITGGFTTYKCNVCDFSYMDDETDPLGHEYKLVSTVEVSCVQDGIESYACERLCKAKDEKYETVTEKAKGHNLKPEPLKVVAATCTAYGYEVYECTDCDSQPTMQRDDMPPTGHTYDKGVVTKPTCTEKGYTTYTCTADDCGYSYPGDYKKALGHSYVSKVVKPTVKKEGYTLHTCSVCKDSYTDKPKAKLQKKENSGTNSNSGAASTPPAANDNSNKKPSSSGSGSKGNSSSKGNSANLSGNVSDTLVVQFFDSKNQALNSGMVTLYDGNTQLKSWSCTYGNVVIVDNLEKYAKDGEVAAYTLKQSKAMDGYEVSKDSFTVQLHKEGSNLKINVKKNKGVKGSSKATKVEKGRDGKPIVSFSNTKKTTQFEIACKTSVEFDGSCYPDEAMIMEYMQKQYKFTLNWTTEDGEAKTETLKLIDGVSGTWQAKIPFGTKYEITAEDADGNVITGFSEEASGTLTAKQMSEKVKVEADIQYKVKPAAPKQLEVNVADPNTGTALKGANFELKGPDGEKIATYISRENGKFYMDDVFEELGDYLLVQRKAPEEYASIKGDIPVNVSLTYVPQGENNVQTLMQLKAVKFAHQSVSANEDGSITIENELYDVVINKNTGKGKGVILGIAGGAVALGAAGATTFVMVKKKRGKNVVEEEKE